MAVAIENAQTATVPVLEDRSGAEEGAERIARGNPSGSMPRWLGRGIDGLISQVTNAVLDHGLKNEMADDLGYRRARPAGAGSGNSRHGFTSRAVVMTLKQTRVDVRANRNGTHGAPPVP